MKIVKELKWQSMLYQILYILMGVVLLLFPETTAKTICYAAGGAAIVVGVVVVCIYLFRDAAKNAYKNDFVSGLVSILLGIFLFYKVDLILELIPFLLGIAVIISGFMKLQNCIDVRRMGYGNGLALFLLALINVIIGIILLVDPFQKAIFLFRLIGVGLIFSGATDLAATLYMFRKVSNFVADMQVLNGSAEDVREAAKKE